MRQTKRKRDPFHLAYSLFATGGGGPLNLHTHTHTTCACLVGCSSPYPLSGRPHMLLASLATCVCLPQAWLGLGSGTLHMVDKK